MCIIFSPAAKTKTSSLSKPKPRNRLCNDRFIKVTGRIHARTTHDPPSRFLKQFTHMSKRPFLRVKPNHHLPFSQHPYKKKIFSKKGTYSKVDRIIHLIRRSEMSEKRTWSVLDRSPWDSSSLECRIVTDGCDDVINDEEFRILPCGFSQFGDDLGAVRVAPVVKDLRTRIKGER